MARLHVLSDLHLEFAPLPRPDCAADVTLLAGDTYTKGKCCPWESATAFFGRPVLMVAGNHEFYDGAVDTAVPRLRTAADAKGARLLECEAAILHGVRFLGCTLWTDFRFHAGDDLARVRLDADRCVGSRHGSGMNDFRRIRVARDGYRRFRPKDAAVLHGAAVAWLSARLAEPFAGPTVVMTHHAPSGLCLPGGTLRDGMAPAYASRLDWLVERFQPDLWVWGHVHEAVPEFRIGRTRMLSNPRGYFPSGLNPIFRPDLVIEV